MAKKIQGFTVKDDGEIPNITPFPPNDYPQCVTVVLHEQRHERVFTESEVRAIVLRAIGMIRSAAKTDIHVGQACGYIGRACSDVGIVLDPA